MLEYKAPEQDIEFLLFDLFKVHERWAEIPALGEVSEELARAVISEAGRVAGEVMAPIDRIASTCSVTIMEPISAAMPAPTG